MRRGIKWTVTSLRQQVFPINITYYYNSFCCHNRTCSQIYTHNGIRTYYFHPMPSTSSMEK